MTARIVELAESVAAALTQQAVAGKFCRQFASERSYADDEMQLVITDEVRVDVVVDGHLQAELLDRHTVGYESGITIVVRYKFDQPNEEEDTGRVALSEIDGLVQLVEQIYEFMAKKRFCESTWRGARIRSTINHRHLRLWQQFTGLIDLRFMVPGELES